MWLRSYLVSYLALVLTVAVLAIPATIADDEEEEAVAFSFDMIFTSGSTAAGTWLAFGAIVDEGSAAETFMVSAELEGGFPVWSRVSRILTSPLGTIAVDILYELSVPGPGIAVYEGEWEIVSGTGAYADLEGSGTATVLLTFTVLPPTLDDIWVGEVEFDD